MVHTRTASDWALWLSKGGGPVKGFFETGGALHPCVYDKLLYELIQYSPWNRPNVLGIEPASCEAVLKAEFVARGVLAMRAVQTRGLPGLHGLTRGEIAQVRQHVATNTKAFQGISVSTPVDAGAVAFMGASLAVALAFIEAWDPARRGAPES